MKGQTTNVLIVIAVVALVGGVAWFRSGRPDAEPDRDTPEAPVATATSAVLENPFERGSTSAPAAEKLPRVVDLGADSCKACKALAPILEELRKEYEGRMTVEFIDVWKNPAAGAQYKIRVIPTQVFFDAEGNEVWRHEGFLPKKDFVARFAELGVK
jgi:thioredoxin 1